MRIIKRAVARFARELVPADHRREVVMLCSRREQSRESYGAETLRFKEAIEARKLSFNKRVIKRHVVGHKNRILEKSSYVVCHIGKEWRAIEITLHNARKIRYPRRELAFWVEECAIRFRAHTIFDPKNTDLNDAIIVTGTRCFHVDNCERLSL